tara:strand:+ start:1027 stop:1938 length:912 start_codon:yes stop_codon:yes gene_type:complete
MEPPRKRLKKRPDWTITFDDPSSLRATMEAVNAVMQRCTFRIHKVDDHHFLMIDGADHGCTCCVSVRLQLYNVTFSDPEKECEEFEFCVECKHVLVAIESAATSQVVVEGYSETAKIDIRVLDPNQMAMEDAATLSTFVDGDEKVELKTLKMDMVIQIDLPRIRDLLKKARKSHSELLTIKVFVDKSGGQERSLLLFMCMGDTNHRQTICSETVRGDDGSLLVKGCPDDGRNDFDIDNDTPVFDDTFPIEKIEAFVKNPGLHQNKMDAHAHKGMPLMLNIGLNGSTDDSSHIRFLVAPVNPDL